MFEIRAQQLRHTLCLRDAPAWRTGFDVFKKFGNCTNTGREKVGTHVVDYLLVVGFVVPLRRPPGNPTRIS